MKIEKRIVRKNNIEIEYILETKKVKNINLRINKDKIVKVSASRGNSKKYIDDFVLEKFDFILDAFNKFDKIETPKELEYINGEVYYFLGDKLILEVLEYSKEEVFIKDNILYLIVKDKNNFKRKQTLIKNFYKEKAKEILTEIVKDVHPRFIEYNIPFPEIVFRDLKAKWGSCAPYKNIITLNINLIKKSYECIEYVVIHEFCHYKHLNHSKEFYNFLSIFSPNYKIIRKILNK